jgi:hypothetical protein
MYELDVRDNGTTLVIKVPQTIWVQALPYLTKRSALTPLERSLHIPSFIPPGSLPWGFSPVFVLEESDPSWTTILCELPQFFSSESSKENEENRWNRAHALSASLYWLFLCLEYAARTETTSVAASQLLEVHIGIGKEDYRYVLGIDAGFSLAACRWIESQTQRTEYTKHPVITEYMINAYKRIYGEEELDRFDLHELRAEIASPCAIHFSTLGNRTGLGSFTNCKQTYGLELYCHNVDTTMQQLILLVGVAGLHSLARKAGY